MIIVVQIKFNLARHENVINVLEICVGSTKDKIFIAMEFLEHDLKTLMETMKQNFTIGEVKTLMKQLMAGVHHLHDNWILHRDLKTSNLLLNHKGLLLSFVIIFKTYHTITEVY